MLNVIQCLKDIANRLKKEKDYVVEEGTNTNWRYRKWNNGTCEAFRKTTSSNLGTSGTVGGFYYRIYSVAIPSGLFTEVWYANASCKWGTGTSWAAARDVTTTNFEAIYFTNQNGGAGIFYHYVMGRWK